MKGILTKYIGPTNTKPGRVKAVVEGESRTATLNWNHDLGVRDNHEAVARELAGHIGWGVELKLHGARLPLACGFTYCFIICPTELPCEFLYHHTQDP